MAPVLKSSKGGVNTLGVWMNYPHVRWDREVNAAYIAFRDLAQEEPSRKLPVAESDGEVIALLRFSADGELVGVELLDAENQIPRSLRE